MTGLLHRNSLLLIRSEQLSYFALFATVFACLVLTCSDPMLAQEEKEGAKDFLESGPLRSSPKELLSWIETIEAKEKASQPSTAAPNRERRVEKYLQSKTLHFRADGKLEITSWNIIKALSRDAAPKVSQWTAEWKPWRCERPQISARVFTSAGEVVENDGKAAFEQAAGDGRNGIVTDRKRLTLLLEGVDKGAIVECKTVEVLSPMVGKAIATRRSLLDFESLHISRLEITADEGVSPEVRAQGGDIRPTFKNKPGEDFRVVYLLEETPGLFDVYEGSTSPDGVSYPSVFAGIPGDWEKLAKAYSETVDEAIESGAAIAKSIVQNAPPKIKNGSEREKLDWAIEKIRLMVRYTGVEFGEHSVFPVSPDTVISRRFGDCKDQSTLLVGMLRELGLTAEVALLSVGSPLEVPKDHPCLDFFNHAIAYVEDLDLWVDLTDEFFSADLISPELRSRRALLCREEGGRIVEIPTYRADRHVEKRVDAFYINFSGGGFVRFLQDGKGDAAVGMRYQYEDAEASDLISQWQQSLQQSVGSSEVKSLQVKDFDDDRFVVAVQSGSTQLFNRKMFTTEALWNHQGLLAQLPSALQPAYVEEGGTPEEVQRKTDVYIREGYREIFGTDFCFPSTLTASPLPTGFSKSFGPVSIRSSFRTIATKDSTDWQVLEGANELSGEDLGELDQLARLYDRTLQVRYVLEVQPGIMKAEDAIACIRFAEQLNAPQSPLTGKVSLTWKALDDHNRAPSNATFDKFLEDALKYRELDEPFVGLMYELAAFGLGEFARRSTEQFTELRTDQSATSGWLPALKLASNENRQRVVPKTGVESLRALMSDAPVKFPEISFTTLGLSCNEFGVHHGLEHSERLEECYALLKQWISSEDFASFPIRGQGAFVGHLTLIGVMLKKDRELEDILATSRFAIKDTILTILRKEERFPFAPEVPVSTRMFLQRVMWEMAVAAERYDLAVHIQQMCENGNAPLKMKLESAEKPHFPNDSSTPEDFARTTLFSLLCYDLETARRSFFDPTKVSAAIEPPVFASGLTSLWFRRERNIRTAASYRTALALTPVETQQICESLAVVDFKYPYVSHLDNEPIDLSINVVRDPRDGKWKVLWWETEAGELCRLMLEHDKPEEARAIMDHFAKPPAPPKNAGFFGIFGNLATEDNRLPEFRLWALMEDTDLRTRVLLIDQIILANEQNDLSIFQNALNDSGLSFSNSQKAVLEQIEESIAMLSGNFKVPFDNWLDRAERSPGFMQTGRLIDIAVYDRMNGGALGMGERYKKVVEKMLELDGIDAIWRMRAEFALSRGKVDEASEIALRQLQEHPEDVNAANHLLWRNIVMNSPIPKLQQQWEAVQAIRPFEQETDAAYVHTVGCVQARLGKTYDALKSYQAASTSPSIEAPSQALMRGLILESMGFKEQALSECEFVIREKPYGKLGIIARAAKKRLEEGK